MPWCSVCEAYVKSSKMECWNDIPRKCPKCAGVPDKKHGGRPIETIPDQPIEKRLLPYSGTDHDLPHEKVMDHAMNTAIREITQTTKYFVLDLSKYQ